jgi:hypothetical protein
MIAYTGAARLVAKAAAEEAGLVVVDPEDREQVKRLMSLFESARGESLFSKDDEHMRAALRSLRGR